MNNLHKNARRGAFALSLMATLLVAAGCSVMPAYDKPEVATPANFKEAPAEWSQVTIKGADGSEWKQAQPSEELARGKWWTVFEDATLDPLVS